jgi:hypothetical protein
MAITTTTEFSILKRYSADHKEKLSGFFIFASGFATVYLSELRARETSCSPFF